MIDLGFIAGGLLLASSPPVASSLAIENCDFGEAYVFAHTICQIGIENPTASAIRLSDATADKAGDYVEVKDLSIAPHSRAYLPVNVALDNVAGASKHIFRFHTDEVGRPEVGAIASGFALTSLDQLREFDFGVVDLTSEKPVEQSIQLESEEVSHFRVLKVVEKPSWLDVSISSDGHIVTSRIRSNAPLGLYAEFIKLALNTPNQHEVWISVKADVHGDVVPAANPLVMGLLRTNNKNEFLIPLTSRSKRNFSLGEIRLDKVEGDVKVEHCTPEAVGCRWLRLTLSDKQPLGTIKGNLFIDLPDNQETLKIAVRGLLVDKDFKVKTLETTKQATSVAQSSVAQTGDLEKAIQNVVEQANATLPTGKGPLLKWTVANGQLIHGFQIFRGDSEKGPYSLLNSSTLRSTSTDDGPTSYQWRDNTAQSAKTYWYYIGIVYADGHKQHLTDPQKVVAK